MQRLAIILTALALLALDPIGQSGGGALSGIVVVPGQGLNVSNETGQTAGEKSIYGRVDANSGWLGDAYYTDLTHDDNAPILFAGTIPEPISLIFYGTGVVGVLGFAVRRKTRPRSTKVTRPEIGGNAQ
jgi:hypothetical protein